MGAGGSLPGRCLGFRERQRGRACRRSTDGLGAGCQILKVGSGAAIAGLPALDGMRIGRGTRAPARSPIGSANLPLGDGAARDGGQRQQCCGSGNERYLQHGDSTEACHDSRVTDCAAYSLTLRNQRYHWRKL